MPHLRLVPLSLILASLSAAASEPPPPSLELKLMLFDRNTGALTELESGGNVVNAQLLAVAKVTGRIASAGTPRLTLKLTDAKKKPQEKTADLDTGLEQQSALFYLAPFSACTSVTFTLSLSGVKAPVSRNVQVPFSCYE